MHRHVILNHTLSPVHLWLHCCIANQSMKIYCVHEVKSSEVLHSFLTLIRGMPWKEVHSNPTKPLCIRACVWQFTIHTWRCHWDPEIGFSWPGSSVFSLNLQLLVITSHALRAGSTSVLSLDVLCGGDWRRSHNYIIFCSLYNSAQLWAPSIPHRISQGVFLLVVQSCT